MRGRIGIAIVAALAILANGAGAATYYVSELFGDDSNDGLSEATPFATIQKAADVMAPGDTVIVDFGTYNEAIVPKSNGTADSPIVYMAKEKGEAEIATGDTVTVPTFAVFQGSVYVAEGIYRTVVAVTEDGLPLIGKDHVDSLVAGTWYQDRAEAKLYVWSSDGADPATHADSVFFAKLSFDILDGSYIVIDGFKIHYGIRAVVSKDEVPLPGLVIQNNEFFATLPGMIGIDIEGGAADTVHTYEQFSVRNNIFNNDPATFSRGIRVRNAGRNSVIADNTFNGGVIPNDATGSAIRVQGSADYPGAQCDGLVIERNFFNKWDKGRALYLRDGDVADITFQNNIMYWNVFDVPTMQFRKRSRNIRIINNTHFRMTSHGYKIYPGVTGEMYNNIFAYGGGRDAKGGSWLVFFDNKTDTTILFDIDYNYWVTDTSMTSSRDDQLIRARNPKSTNIRPGPHAVFGHPLIPRPDSVITATGDTIYINSLAVTVTGDTVVLDSIPDMWFSAALPLFADTAAATAEGMGLVEGSPAIDAGWAAVAPAEDFFGNPRDDKPDMGAIEYQKGVAVRSRPPGPLPRDYVLYPNHPNPFNASTLLVYDLPRPGKVRVVVYDLIGRRVAVLREGFQGAGRHQMTWDGTDSSGRVLPTGVYICRLEAGSVAKSIKMLMLR